MNQERSAISVKNVTKVFHVHSGKNSTLKEKIIYAGREKRREFVALKDVSLEIQRGTTVGLLGVNGSGKSTLLKLISRILYPDSGTIEVHGRVSSLLELGAGFHPDFTGIENIFMNGALLGLKRRQILERIDDIVDFSELGDFIHEPVRNYSSGMYMRLAFSVAVAVDPEILLIDEILAVGDAAFQAKCISRIKQLKAQNKTIVIVTHDIGAVERLCDKAVWMNQGCVNMEGDPVDCVQEYIGGVFRDSRSGQSIMSFNRNSSAEESIQALESQPDDLIGNKTEENEQLQPITINDVRLMCKDDSDVVRCGDSLGISVSYTSSVTEDDVVFGIAIFNEEGVRCYGTNTSVDKIENLKVTPGDGEFSIHIEEMNLLPGRYLVDVAIHKEDGEPYEYLRHATEFVSISNIQDVGICRMAHTWDVQI